MSRTLIVKPIKAELIRDVDWITKMDPYVIVILGIHKAKTSICNSGGKYPEWKDTLIFTRSNEEFMIIEVWDNQTFESNRLIGRGEISILNVLINEKILDWIPLTYDNKQAGKILLEVIAESEGLNVLTDEGGITKTTIRESFIEEFPSENKGFYQVFLILVSINRPTKQALLLLNGKVNYGVAWNIHIRKKSSSNSSRSTYDILILEEGESFMAFDSSDVNQGKKGDIQSN